MNQDAFDQPRTEKNLRFASFDDLRRYLDRLERSRTETTGAWTVGQIFYHLAASIELSLQPSSLQPGIMARLKKLPVRWRVLRRGLPRGVSIPKPVRDRIEPPDDVDPTEQLARLRKALDAFEARSGLPPVHSVIGPLTRCEWVTFHLRHGEHHLNNVRFVGEA